jgi:hypothetical protein
MGLTRFYERVFDRTTIHRDGSLSHPPSWLATMDERLVMAPKTKPDPAADRLDFDFTFPDGTVRRLYIRPMEPALMMFFHLRSKRFRCQPDCATCLRIKKRIQDQRS